MGPTPVFLLSLPRTGSTLVQRVLATHPDVATTSEPWVALPVLAPVDRPLPLAGAWDGLLRRAIGDFAEQMPDGMDGYLAAIRRYLESLYDAVSPPGARWFVDKSPSYAFVADSLFRAFPDAGFIFLWRHPLAVATSMFRTFGDGRWDTHRHRTDLFEGLARLVEAAGRFGDRSVSVRYEDLVGAGRPAWTPLGEHLGLEISDDVLRGFSARRLAGSMGDPTGVDRYRSLSREPVDRWRDDVGNPLRRAWCRRYLCWIGADRLAVMGYDLDELLGELDDVPRGWSGLPEDAHLAVGSLVREAIGARTRADLPRSQWRSLLDAGAPGRRANRG